MYIDEVGNADMGPSLSANERYLSLTGVIVGLDHVRDYLHPQIEALKERYFGSHPDSPVVLHRRDMMKADGNFASLRDPTTRGNFDSDLFDILVTADYTVLTAVIDKLAHRTQYTTWAHHPYHYCLEILLERYVMWLSRRNARGDVMAESRGGAEDRLLKQEYTSIYTNGTDFVTGAKVSSRLTTRQLKVEQKRQNIAGLQLADVLASPCLKWAHCHRSATPLPSNFGGMVAALLDAQKLDRSTTGRIEGYGVKWLP